MTATLEELADIDKRFAPQWKRGEGHQAIRDACHRAAEELTHLTPPGRERALALTALQEAMFWGQAALDRAHDDEVAD